MITTALTISIVLAASALTVAYGLGGLWIPAAVVLVVGALWVLGERAGWSWISWPMVVLFAGAAAVGALLSLNHILLLIGLIAALSAWDLDHLARQLDRVDAVEHESAMKRRHLLRLLAVDGLGLLFAVVALLVEIRLSFGLALVLGLVALLGLSCALRFFRRESGS
jgi:hypothetical protein